MLDFYSLPGVAPEVNLREIITGISSQNVNQADNYAFNK